MTADARPLGGRIMVGPTRVMAVVFLVGVAAMVYRLVAGLGATTAMSDGYPWGLWIAIDVVVGTALASGGYAMALIVYIFNKGQYHPLVRPAVLTSALGYTMAGIGISLDVGRWWSLSNVPVYFWRWNANSVLLEVALCVMAYIALLWVELAPAFLEKAKDGSKPRLRAIAARLLPVFEKSLVWILALGLLLPTMHQSSLGTLILLAGPRLHPLWNTPWIPLLFLVSTLAMGFAVVVFESAMATLLLRVRGKTEMLAGIAGFMVPIVFLYPALRVADIVWRGHLGTLLAFDTFSILALVEIAMAVAPGIMLMRVRRRQEIGYLLRAAMLMMGAGALYRVNAYLVAFQPGAQWSYFPSIGEILITLGLLAAQVLVYMTVVRLFPILSGAPAAEKAGVGWAPTLPSTR